MYLVTGGAGFIGSHVVRRLINVGEDVRVLDNLSTGSLENLNAIGDDVETIVGDIRDQAIVAKAMVGVDVVLHLAAAPSVVTSVKDPQLTIDVNVAGTLNVLLAARDAGCRRVVLASSSAVYGENRLSPKSEDLTPDPRSPYAVSKLSGEQLCSNFTELYGLPTVALRYFNVFGPGQDPDSPYSAVIPRFLRSFLQSETPTIYGDGAQTRDFVYVDNVVDANLLAANRDAAIGKVFNVGTGIPTSLIDILSIIAGVLRQPALANYEDARPGDIRHSLADITRAQTLLGFKVSTAFAEGMAMTIQAMQGEFGPEEFPVDRTVSEVFADVTHVPQFPVAASSLGH